jgi:hypothetical protein
MSARVTLVLSLANPSTTGFDVAIIGPFNPLLPGSVKSLEVDVAQLKQDLAVDFLLSRRFGFAASHIMFPTYHRILQYNRESPCARTLAPIQ